jgi:hypothetical protein
MENRGKRRNTTGRGHCFGGGARFEWDMATDIGTYQGGIIGRHTPISLPCAEGEWHVVGLHTYGVAQGHKIATGATATRGVGSKIVGKGLSDGQGCMIITDGVCATHTSYGYV